MREIVKETTTMTGITLKEVTVYQNRLEKGFTRFYIQGVEVEYFKYSIEEDENGFQNEKLEYIFFLKERKN